MYSSNRANVPVRHEPRPAARATTACGRILSLVLTILFSYSSFPLRAAALGGFVVAGLSFLLGGFYLVRGFFVETPVEGWTTLASCSRSSTASPSRCCRCSASTSSAPSTRSAPRRATTSPRGSSSMTRHFLVIGASAAARRTSTSCSPSTRRSPWPGRRGPSPRCSSPTRSATGASSGTATTYFAHADRREVLGEKSTSYLEDPRSADPRRGGPRRRRTIVVQLRDPVERAVSNWRFSTDHGLEDRRSTRPCASNLDGRDAPGTRQLSSVSPVRLPRTRPVRRPPPPVAGRLPGTRCRCSSSRSCSRDDDRARRALCTGLGVDPGVRPPACDSRCNQGDGPAPELDARTWPTSSSDYFAASDRALAETARARPALVDRPAWTATASSDLLTAPSPGHPVQRTVVEGRELDYVRQSIESGHTVLRRTVLHPGRGDPRARTTGRRGAADHLVHLGARAVARCCWTSGPGDTVDRAVVHVHHHRARLRAPGRPDPVLRHRAATPSAWTRSTSRAARRHGPGRRGRPLRRHRLRRRRASARCWRTAPTSRSIEDNAHGLFGTLARAAARQPRPVRGTELPRDEELRLRRGRRPAAQRPPRRGAGPGPLRQGHQPPGVLARPGGQVLLAGHRLVVRALRHARRLPAGPARAARVDPGASAARVFEHYTAALAPQAERLGFRAAGVPARRGAGVPHVLRADARPRDPRRGDGRRCASEGIQTTFHYVPLHNSDGGQHVRRPADRVPGDRATSAAGCCGCRSTTTWPTTTSSGWWTRSSRPGAATARSPVSDDRDQPGSSSIEHPDYWWYRARTQLLQAVLGDFLGTAAAAARRGQRRRAERVLDAGGPPAGRDRRGPPGTRPGRGCLRLRDWRCRSATGRSTWSARSTWSSTASRRSWRSRSWHGCWRRGAGCCSPCRPTSGRGPTTTCGPVTTAATRDPGWSRRWRAPGSRTALDLRFRRRSSRCSPPSGSLRRLAAATAGRRAASGLAHPGPCAMKLSRAREPAAPPPGPAVRLIGLPERREALTRLG